MPLRVLQLPWFQHMEAPNGSLCLQCKGYHPCHQGGRGAGTSELVSADSTAKRRSGLGTSKVSGCLGTPTQKLSFELTTWL